MKISLNQKLKTLNGEVIKQSFEKGKKIEERELTFAEVFIQSLLTSFEDEQKLSGIDKMKRYVLAQKINRNKDKVADLTVEEVALIKELIGKGYNALVVGQVWETLEK